jgi:HD-like signal output (HDOD) protein
MDTLTTAPADRARDIVRRAHGITPSASLLRIEEQLRRGDASTRQLAQLVEGSPALAARVLRMANSAFYAPVEPVVSLNRAIVMLGEMVLRQLVLTSLITSRGAGKRNPHQALASARLMGDAVRCATVGRHLAELSRVGSRDEVFVGALLHDLGHIYLLDEVGDDYATYLLEGRSGQDAFVREMALCGTTHTEVGAAFAVDWQLPGAVVAVLRDHHEPQPGTAAQVVWVADRVVRELTAAAAGDPFATKATDDGLAAIGVDRARWDERVPRVKEEYAELLTVFDAIA